MARREEKEKKMQDFCLPKAFKVLLFYTSLFWKYSLTQYFSGAQVPGPVLDAKDTAQSTTSTVYTHDEFKQNSS